MTNRVLPSAALQSLSVRGRATCEIANCGRIGCACYVPIGDADYDMATDATYFGRTLLRGEPSAANRTVLFSTARLDPYPESYDGMIKLVLNAGDNNRRLTVESADGDFSPHTLGVGEMLMTVLSNGRWTVNGAGDQTWTYDVGTNTVSLVPAGATVETNDLEVDGKLTVTGLIDPTGVVLDEQAAVPSPTIAGKGTLWVRNDAPNRLMFTDDTGADFPLGTGGDVNGPAAATDTAVAIFDGATGKLIKNSSLTTATGADLTVPGVATLGGTAFPGAPGAASELLVADGGGNAVWTTPSFGDVAGPAASVNNHLALYNGVTGKLLKDTSPIVVAGGAVTGITALTTTNLTVTTTAILGGTTFPSAIGAPNEILIADGGGNAAWTAPPYGDVARNGSSADERLARWHGTTATIQNSVVGLTDAGDMTGVRSFTTGGGTVTLNNHVWPASTGTNGYVMTTNGGSPATLTWTNPSATYLWRTTTESTFSVLRPQGAGATNTLCFGAVTPYDTGTGARMFFDVAKAALRAGNTSAATWWQLSNVGTGSIALGNDTMASASYATVSGGRTNTASAQYSTVGGGQANNNSGFHGVIGGGQTNTNSGFHGVIAGGSNNSVSNQYSAIGGGYQNGVTSQYGTIGGGTDNSVTGQYSTVAGGQSNTASGDNAAIGGGNSNTVSGDRGCVPGGRFNAVSGTDSLCCGSYASDGGFNDCFVFADGTAIASGAANRATFGVAGGYYIYTNAAHTTGMFMAGGASSWSAVSDRQLKTDIATVDYDRMLERVDAGGVDVYTYRMKRRDPGHDAYNVGTMADEFAALAPPTGKPDTSIDHGDAGGVNLALAIAIRRRQTADQARIAALEKRNAALEARVDALEAENTAFKERFARLEESLRV